MESKREKGNYDLDEIINDYINELRGVLHSEEGINVAVRNAEIIKGKPTLDMARTYFDPKGNTNEKNPPQYIDQKRTETQRRLLGLQTRSDLEAIVIASAHFEAGQKISFKIATSTSHDPAKARQLSTQLGEARIVASSEFSPHMRIADIKNYTFTVPDEKQLKAIKQVIKLRMMCEEHLKILKEKNPKNKDIPKIEALLKNLSDTSISPAQRAGVFLHDVKAHIQGMSKLGSIFKKVTGDIGLYGLWEKLKPEMPFASLPQERQKVTKRP